MDDRDFLRLGSSIVFQGIVVISAWFEYCEMKIKSLSSDLRALWQSTERIWFTVLIDRLKYIARDIGDRG